MSYQQKILQTWNQEFGEDNQEKSNEQLGRKRQDPDFDASRNDIMKNEYKIQNYISFMQTSN